ncbi:MAG: HAD family hydrolase [Bacteroidaceae bacterium]|nr:HAD family hydrolase [Bacteroidaceae bacterium]
MNSLHPLSTIIFDYGGTLDTNARHWAHVLWEGYQHANVPVSEAQFREAYVFGERALAKAPIVKPEDNFHTVLLKKLDQETAELLRMGVWQITEPERQIHIKAIADYCNNYVLRNLESSRTVLDTLKDRYNLVLVSNFYGNIEAILRDFRLEHYFSAIVESAVVGVRKPDPAIYRLGVEAAGVDASEVLVVGDSYDKDIVPAKAIGCKAVWLKGEGWKPEIVDESLPDAIIKSLNELVGLLHQ